MIVITVRHGFQVVTSGRLGRSSGMHGHATVLPSPSKRVPRATADKPLVGSQNSFGQGAASSSERGASNSAGEQHRPLTQASIVAFATSPAIAAATSAARSAAAAAASAVCPV